MRRVIVFILLAISLTFFVAAESRPRNLIVYFEFLDNANGVEDAVEFIFNKMLRPGDQLIIQSPTRTYSFSPATLSQPKAGLIAMVQGKLRRDISRAGQGYKQVIHNLDAAAREIEELAYPSGAIDTNKDMNELFILYRQELANLNQLRKVKDASLRTLTAAFRGREGENHLIVLFEREFRPIPKREALNVLADVPKYAFQSNELFATGNPRQLFDVPALAAYFKQVPLAQHFIYVTSKNSLAGGNLFENSGDMYSAFSKLAEATGGVCKTTAEPMTGLEAVLKTWKNAK
ncbi:MAG: hypothetical protein PHX05_03590 [Acidobacteriota bacterium]|nr:hypothetical protein [Acidobacteriota bacterium]